MKESAGHSRPNPPTRPEHTEAYWQTIKWVILGLGALMVLAVVLAIVIALRVIPWS